MLGAGPGLGRLGGGLAERRSLWRVIRRPLPVSIPPHLMTGSSVPSEEEGLHHAGPESNRHRVEAGQTMAEYAVVLGVITIAVVVTLGLPSAAIRNLLSNVISVLLSQEPPPGHAAGPPPPEWATACSVSPPSRSTGRVARDRLVGAHRGS